MRLLQARYVYIRRRLLGSLLLRLTKRRILRRRPHGKPHFAPAASRKTAFCNRRLTERRTLGSHSHGKAHFACGSHQKAHSVSEQSRRVRLSVRVRAQNALFRRMCFSSPAQTSGGLTEKRTLDRHLTEKRTLQPSPHVKAHSVPATLPRRHGKAHSAPATLPRRHGKAHSAPGDSRKSAFCVGDATST